RQLQLPSPAIKSPNCLSEQRTCSGHPGYLFGAKEGTQPENHAKAPPCSEAAPSFCEVYSGSQSPYLCQNSQSPHFRYGAGYGDRGHIRRPLGSCRMGLISLGKL
ncbi:hypothetical protein U0070_013232, partial [Myodes glareolus]